MPHDRLNDVLASDLTALQQSGRAKGAEMVITGILPAKDEFGPRYRLDGEGGRGFLRMNSNGYLSLARHPAVMAAGEAAVAEFGTGPGAVRFISGTWAPHIALEHRLAAFHGRQAAMAFSSAYATVMGTIAALTTPETAIVSDSLNHSCIINGTRLAAPKRKLVYPHLDMTALEAALREAATDCKRVILVTDGVFSMRGDHAPLGPIMDIAQRLDPLFAENILVMVDDSHGVGAFGVTGRGTEEVTGCPPVDLLIGTLGKAFGVNGGYIAADRAIVDYLRETAAFYIYSNPISPGEAAAADKAASIVDSPEGKALLAHLRSMRNRFADGLNGLGFETIEGDHPIVPLMVRDTAKTRDIVSHLKAHGILATGLNYPVVPEGDQTIRFQINAEHTAADIDLALKILSEIAPSVA